jgi:hypothetical protein
MFLRRRHLLAAAVVSSLLGLLFVPALAAGQGATQSVETFTEEADWFGPDACTGLTIVGTGTQSGTSYVTETPNGGIHVRVDIQGSVDLYQANGPGPWDPQPGAFIGSWSYQTSISDQAPPDGQGSTTGVTSGLLVFPDGTTAKRQLVFHLTWEKNGPPKLFFVKFICAGA